MALGADITSRIEKALVGKGAATGVIQRLNGVTNANLSTNLANGATTTTLKTKLNALLASMRLCKHIDP